MVALVRSMTRSSRGNTWYFSASCMNRACICFSFAGCSAARFRVRLKSFFASYSSQTSDVSGRFVVCHAARWMVRASQPSR